MKKIILSLVFLTVSLTSYACNKSSYYPGFELNGVPVQGCFTMPHMASYLVYKLTAVCKNGGFYRNAFYKMKNPSTGAWGSEQVTSVRTPWF